MRRQIKLIAQNWHDSMHDKGFRERLVVAIIGIVIMSFCTHFFFDFNETHKGGLVMNDWVLKELPAENVSMPITVFMLSVLVLFIIRAVPNPPMLVTALIAYSILLIFRIITIAVTHFQAPPELITLHDPVSDLVYGSKSITRDLFFSGHIATISLVYLCLAKKTDKHYLLFVAFSVAMLLLLQHIHYTIDIICAPFFALGSLWLSKKMAHFRNIKIHSLQDSHAHTHSHTQRAQR